MRRRAGRGAQPAAYCYGYPRVRVGRPVQIVGDHLDHLPNGLLPDRSCDLALTVTR